MKKRFVVPLIVFTLLTINIILEVFKSKFNREIILSIEKKEFSLNDPLRIKIKNVSSKNVCFSSCYPYFLEKKDKEWKPYSYEDCPKENINQFCLKPKETKVYEILGEKEKGIHRIVLPACLGCNDGEVFRNDKIFYSNEFIIK